MSVSCAFLSKNESQTGQYKLLISEQLLMDSLLALQGLVSTKTWKWMSSILCYVSLESSTRDNEQKMCLE